MDKAILITYDKEDTINEAKGLCEAAGYEVVPLFKKIIFKNQNMELVEEY